MYINGGRVDTKPRHRYRCADGMPFWLIAAHKKGSYLITGPDGQSFECDNTAFYLIAPNTPYETYSEKGYSGVIWIYFTPPAAMLPLLNWPEEVPGRHALRVSSAPLRKEMYTALKYAVDTALDQIYPQHEVLALNGVERLLMLGSMDSALSTLHDPRILNVLNLIHAEPGRHWTLKELAAAASMSPSNFSRLFTGDTGHSPIHYVEIRRIEQAKTLLIHTNNSISQIAEDLGYIDPYHFSNRFRDATKTSPRDFRKNPAAHFSTE
ncbi:MAG: AraC family transcriptional regulator [Chthoniobacterales bacterium]